MKAHTIKKIRRIGGHHYSLSSSHRKKMDANKAADRLRSRDMTARVEKAGGLYRVFKGPHDKR